MWKYSSSGWWLDSWYMWMFMCVSVFLSEMHTCCLWWTFFPCPLSFAIVQLDISVKRAAWGSAAQESCLSLAQEMGMWSSVLCPWMSDLDSSGIGWKTWRVLRSNDIIVPWAVCPLDPAVPIIWAYSSIFPLISEALHISFQIYIYIF